MKRRQTFLLVAFALFVTGCMSKLTGVNQRITFAYLAAESIENFHKPIAAGARLDLHAMELTDDDEAMTIVAAASHDPEVLSVECLENDRVVLLGRAVGSARIEVTARDRYGKQHTDVVDMSVRSPDHVAFGHSCTDELFAVYPAGTEITLPWAMYQEDERPLVGYGFHPFRATPAGAMEFLESRETGMLRVRTGAPRHRASIRSTIDDALLGLAFARPKDVDGITTDSDEMILLEGDEAFAFFRPTVAGVPFCDAGLETLARSKTPEICEASGKLDDDDDEESNRIGFAKIHARRFGHCEIEVVFPEAASGAGVAKTVTIPVGKLPSASEEEQSPEPAWWGALLALLAPLVFAPALLVWRSMMRRRAR